MRALVDERPKPVVQPGRGGRVEAIATVELVRAGECSEARHQLKRLRPSRVGGLWQNDERVVAMMVAALRAKVGVDAEEASTARPSQRGLPASVALHTFVHHRRWAAVPLDGHVSRWWGKKWRTAGFPRAFCSEKIFWRLHPL